MIEQWKPPEPDTSTEEEVRRLITRELKAVNSNLESNDLAFKKIPPLRRITEILLPIAQLLKNDDFIGFDFSSEIKQSIETDTAYEKIKLLLALYLDHVLILDKFPENETDPYLRSLREAALLFRTLARSFYSALERTSDRTTASLYAPYKDERTCAEYRELLFSEISPEDFETYLAQSAPGNWLDIGSGNTYRNEESLMHKLQSINPGITVHGIDPVYSLENARPIDVLSGHAGIDSTNLFSNNLRAGTGQRLPYEKDMFEKVLLGHVLTWMDQRHQIGQILRQAARVLKPGGELRVSSVSSDIIDESNNPLNEYFEVVHRKKRESLSTVTDGTEVDGIFYDVVAIKKNLSNSQQIKLQKDIDFWLRKYPT